jgi:hypothetical protein
MNVLGVKNVPNHTPVYQAYFNMHTWMNSNKRRSLSNADTLFSADDKPIYENSLGSKLDLCLQLYARNDGSFRGLLEYSTDLFKPESAQRMVRQFDQLLTAIIKFPDVPISKLSMTITQEVCIVSLCNFSEAALFCETLNGELPTITNTNATFRYACSSCRQNEVTTLKQCHTLVILLLPTPNSSVSMLPRLITLLQHIASTPSGDVNLKRVMIITCGSHGPALTCSPFCSGGAGVMGLVRSTQPEISNIKIVCVDTDKAGMGSALHVACELMNPLEDSPDQIIYRDNIRYTKRLKRIPKLSDLNQVPLLLLPPGCQCNPTIDELTRMSDFDRKHVSNFLLKKHAFGSICFDGDIDITTVTLEVPPNSTPLLSWEGSANACTGVVLYPDPVTKPARGQGLNRPAMITLCYHKNCDQESVRSQMERSPLNEADKMEFSSYNSATGELKFHVDHFSRWTVATRSASENSSSSSAQPTSIVFMFAGEGAHSTDTDIATLKTSPAWPQIDAALRAELQQPTREHCLRAGARCLSSFSCVVPNVVIWLRQVLETTPLQYRLLSPRSSTF